MRRGDPRAVALQDSNAVEREVRIAARPETIFPFFLEPEKLTRWLGASATLEPHPGGVFHVFSNEQAIISGQYLEVEPFRRVVFTWGWEHENAPLAPGSTTVEITLVAEGNETILRLRHTGLPSEQKSEKQAAGWEHYLHRLMVAAEGDDPGPDPWATLPML